MYKLHHICLYTNNFSETIKFYKDVFKCYPRGFFKKDGKDACMLYLNEDVILEIFEKDDAYNDGCFHHIAIACDHVDELYEKALECGAISHQEPRDVVLGLEKPISARIAFVIGKANEKIELFDEKRVE